MKKKCGKEEKNYLQNIQIEKRKKISQVVKLQYIIE